MNLFGVGPLELVVILVVALIFVGPDKLPRLAADLARTIRDIRKYTGGLAAEFQEVVKDVEKQTESERGIWKDVTEGIGGATKQVTDAVRTVRTDVNTALADTKPAATPPPATNGASNAAVSAPSATNGAAAKTGWVEIADPDAEVPSVPEPAPASEQPSTPAGSPP